MGTKEDRLEKLKKIVAQLRMLIDEPFYGRVEVKFESGNPVYWEIVKGEKL